MAEDVEVTLDSDGKVENISLAIISEGEVAYEPPSASVAPKRSNSTSSRS